MKGEFKASIIPQTILLCIAIFVMIVWLLAFVAIIYFYNYIGATIDIITSLVSVVLATYVAVNIYKKGRDIKFVRNLIGPVRDFKTEELSPEDQKLYDHYIRKYKLGVKGFIEGDRFDFDRTTEGHILPTERTRDVMNAIRKKFNNDPEKITKFLGGEKKSWEISKHLAADPRLENVKSTTHEGAIDRMARSTFFNHLDIEYLGEKVDKVDDFEPDFKSQAPKIIVIDDDVFMLSFIMLKLRLAGFNVIARSQADDREEKFVDWIARIKPDLIMTDIIMPVRSGFEEIEILKKDSRTQDIPVVVLSNQSERKDIERANQLGVVRYIISPSVTPDDIVSELQELTGFDQPA